MLELKFDAKTKITINDPKTETAVKMLVLRMTAVNSGTEQETIHKKKIYMFPRKTWKKENLESLPKEFSDLAKLVGEDDAYQKMAEKYNVSVAAIKVKLWKLGKGYQDKKL